MQGRVASFVGGVQLRLKIDEATSNKDDPTPIYFLDEIAHLLGSQSDTLLLGVDHICRRLGNKSPTVKQKALRLVKHLCLRGSPDFRRHMTKHSSVIRELTHYRCEPDPFKGDIPWKRVQQMAHETLTAMHSTMDSQGNPPALGGRIQGFGKDSASGAASQTGMIGFGSDSQSHNFMGSGIVSGGTGQNLLSSISNGVKTIGASLSRQQDSLLSQDGYGVTNSEDTAENAASPNVLSTSAATDLHGVAGNKRGGSQSTSQEARAVGKICTPAGLRAAPDRSDLQSFVEMISSLDGTQVARLLQEKMEQGPWQATLRALYALEAIVENGSSASCGAVAVHFQAYSEPVRKASGSPQSSVRHRATKVLSLLGDATLPSQGQGSAAADLIISGHAPFSSAATASNITHQTVATGLDLLSIDLESSGVRDVHPQLQGAGLDLSADVFNGLRVSSEQLNTVTAGSKELGHVEDISSAMTQQALPQQQTMSAGVFDFLEYTSQPTVVKNAARESGDSQDLFSQLSIVSGGSCAEGCVSQPNTSNLGVQLPQRSHKLDDLLSNLHLTVTPSPPEQKQPMRSSSAAGIQHIQNRSGPLQTSHAEFTQPQQQNIQQHLSPNFLGTIQRREGLQSGAGDATQQTSMDMQVTGRMPLPAGNHRLQPVSQGHLLFAQQQQSIMMQMQQLGLSPMQMQELLQQRAPSMQQSWRIIGSDGHMTFPVGHVSQRVFHAKDLSEHSGGSGRGAVPLEDFHDTTSRQPSTAPMKDTSFDFVGDHLQALKKK